MAGAGQRPSPAFGHHALRHRRAHHAVRGRGEGLRFRTDTWTRRRPAAWTSSRSMRSPRPRWRSTTPGLKIDPGERRAGRGDRRQRYRRHDGSFEETSALDAGEGGSPRQPLLRAADDHQHGARADQHPLRAKGPNWATVSACATGAHAIGEAMRTIQYGDADVVIAGGAEASVTPLGVGGFCAMRALSTRNDAPEKASRPFDRDRDGFVIAEGAGILILEEVEHAKRRGAPDPGRARRLRRHRRRLPHHYARRGRGRRRPLHEEGPRGREAQSIGDRLHQRARDQHAAWRPFRDGRAQDGLRLPRQEASPSPRPNR